MTARGLWRKLRALLDADKRLGVLQAALAASRVELHELQRREADARAASTAALRTELVRIAAGLEAFEKRLSALDTEGRLRQALLDERLAALDAATRTAVERAAALEGIASSLEALSRELTSTRTDLKVSGETLAERVAGLESAAIELRSGEPWRAVQAEVEQTRHLVSHQADQLDLLKSSLEVDPLLIEEFQEWKAGHRLSQRPLVSVCVATYNRSVLLRERCLPSVLGQTYPHLEVIVVGDGCTDDTAERVAKIGDPRIRFVNLPRRGSYPADPMRQWMVAGTPAVNKALARARGELITHLDDDDEYQPERLEKLVSFLRTNECDLVWHPFWYEDTDGRWLLNEAAEFAFSRVTTSSVLYRAWFKKIRWDLEAHRLMEPGDWNRFRRLRYLGAVCMRFPEPMLRHYRERRPDSRRTSGPGS